MKFTCKISSVGISFVFRLALLLLAGSGSTTIFAQGTTNMAAMVSAVSQYPKDPSLLPGKGPATTWTELPKIWAERHAEWAQTADKNKGAVVFLGDSITQGWHSLANAFPNLKVVNRGIGGDTTRGVLYRLKADVLNLDPKAIVLLIGINDVGLGAKPEDVADNIETILQEIKKINPNLPVIVCQIMPSGEKQQRRAGTIEKINALVAAAIKNDPQFTLCDTWSIYANKDGDCPKDEFPDLIHPNAAGYAKWAAALKPIFARLNPGTEKM
jgi:lysophospholipase L1-like esterase